MTALRVGFDTGPLHGPRTGIGHAVEAMRQVLEHRDDVELVPYVLSFRARPTPTTVRLPLPAAIAHRLWGHTGHPRVDRWLRGVDVVHGTNYVVGPSALPTLVSVYDCWFLRHPDLAAPAVHRAGAVLRAAVRRGATVHASSAATADAVGELLPGADVHVVPLGALPLPDPAPTTPVAELDHHPFVLAVGTLERRKNLPRLVAAFGRIASAHPDLRLVLAGAPGDDHATVVEAIDALGSGVAPRVLLTGRIDEPTRGWLLRRASVLAYPSLDEGFGFPLLDAMQAGVPLVAAQAGSIPEVAGDAALLCDPLDIDGIAAALDRVVADDTVRDSLVTAGSSRWREFSWERCGDGMAELYGRVAGRRPGA